MFILKNKNLFLSISAIAVILSLLSILVFGLKKNIDFTGGTKLSVEGVVSENLKNNLTNNFGNINLNPLQSGDTEIKLKTLDEAGVAKLNEILRIENKTAKEFSVIGPSISSEIVSKAIIGFILVAFAIIIFITFSFWGIGENKNFQVSSFKYGLVTIVTLLHDIIIPTGVFAFLGYLSGVEVDSLFVVALLTILGVSVSDTIVVFDRVRENIKNAVKGESFEDIIGKSLNQSFVRSLATSVSVIAVLLALVFFGPESTRFFAITITIGMFVGTYSSLFVASPLLVLVQKYWPSKVEEK